MGFYRKGGRQMSKRLIKWMLLVLTICFLILGFIFKSTAEKQKGVSVSAGAIINGEYVETDSGRMGANYEKYNSFNDGGTIFYVLAGVTGVICIVTFISDRKSR